MPKYNRTKHWGTFVPKPSYYAARAIKVKTARAHMTLRRGMRHWKRRLEARRAIPVSAAWRAMRIRHTRVNHARGRCCRPNTRPN